jgi:hypothetical protein
MENELNTGKCRKCGAENPQSNQYCASCGAILKVSTGMIEAQPKPVMPFVHRFEKRWLFAAIFVFMGVWVISLILLVVFSWLFFNAAVTEFKFGQTDIQTRLLPVLLPTLGTATVLYFSAGVLISRLARDAKVAETVLAAIFIAIGIGIAGSVISSDSFIASSLFGTPGVIAAGLGARFGGKKFMRSS